MPHSLIWLPAALQSAGLKVALVDGWEVRGRGEFGPLRGVLCHHTAGSKNGNMPTLKTLVEGRSDLPGPLSQLGLGRDGTYYVIAAGRCNHAGGGHWNGITSGNQHFIGIEAENTGRGDDMPWPAIQIEAYQRGVAAILKHAGLPVSSCAGHKEYAQPAGRKTDPTLDMAKFRSSVAELLRTGTPAVLIPATEPPLTAGDATGRPTLRRGMRNDWVRQVQRKLELPVDGDFGGETEAAVRVFQRLNHLVPDGIIGPKTWALLAPRASAQVQPGPN